MPKSETEYPSQEISPDPALEKRSRRVFSTEYKLSILQQAAACKHGELGALLRREKLYHNQLSQWRQEFSENGAEGLAKSAPGPKSKLSVEQRRIAQLEKQNAQLQRQLHIKEACIELQKKAFVMLENLDEEGSS
jgi:transposase-like protein